VRLYDSGLENARIVHMYFKWWFIFRMLIHYQ